MTLLEIYPRKEYPEALEFCKLFLREKTRPRYVLGRNEYAASVAKFVDVNGFIDDFTGETEFLGKPILKMTEVPKESMVVSSVIFVVPVTALRKLKSHGFDCLDYFSFMKYSGLPLKEVRFLTESRNDLENNLPKYQWLYNNLRDNESKEILLKLLNFRASEDLNYMFDFESKQANQYFEDFFKIHDHEVFVDAGGYDGQTSLEFIKRCPKYKTIHFFEPDAANVALARKNLSGNQRICFYTKGLAENKKTLKFSSGGGSASMLSEEGDMVIEVDAMDNLIKEKVSFIKMDIEGAEGPALEGAKIHILEDHPNLAVCCYHKVDDFWKIPEYVFTIRDDYHLYLRHYTDGLHETVIYFIPDA